jgi:hypothetical protein
MTLPAYPSAISLLDLQNAEGGGSPISLSEYYAVRDINAARGANSYVNSGAVGYPQGGGAVAIPATAGTTISLDNFHGAVYPNSTPFASQNFSTPGSYSITAPPMPTGWNSMGINVYAVGAGGGGGGGAATKDPKNDPYASGGGGGAGSIAINARWTVTPGASGTVYVGRGGPGGGGSITYSSKRVIAQPGQAGGDSAVYMGSGSTTGTGGRPGGGGFIDYSNRDTRTAGSGGYIDGQSGAAGTDLYANGGRGGQYYTATAGAGGTGTFNSATSGSAGGTGSGGGGGGAQTRGGSGEHVGAGGTGGNGYVTLYFYRAS